MGQRRGRNLVGHPEGKITLRWILKEQHGGVDWIEQAQDKWRAVVNMLMNL
jgi:hypothetical protein